jgi:gamma-glutamylcyclotransferase (GGCT)/AIG2-like uncharacterized protein YtfP
MCSRGRVAKAPRMSSYLFVYGTLLSAAGHPMGARLRREARLIGQASFSGRLYRISHYPGLVEDPAAPAPVTGEVYELNNPAASLPWLDAYEGIVPGTGGRNEYERVQRAVRLASGEELTTWVYLYRKPVSGLRLIPEGRWS